MTSIKSMLVGALVSMNTILVPSVMAQESAVKLQTVNPAGLYDPAPFGYSHVIVASGGSRVAYIAGQGAETKNEADGYAPTMEGQLAQSFKNLMIAIEAVGGKPDQVVKINTYFVNYDMSMLEPLGKEIAKHFGEHIPAQTLVPVPRLAIDGMLFEIDAIVVLE